MTWLLGQPMPIVVFSVLGVLCVVVGVAELAGYFMMYPRFLGLASRGLGMDIVPVPGLARDDLLGFRGQTEGAIYRYDSGSEALLIRRRHDSLVKRIPAWLYITFTEDSQGQLQPKVRWTALPYLSLLAFWVSGMWMCGSLIGPSLSVESLLPVVIMCSFLTAMVGAAYAVFWFQGRSAAHMMLAEVEVLLLARVQTGKVS